MTDLPENYQQNVVNDDRRGKTPGARQAQFKPGYDPRRWLNGRGKKSPEQKEGEKILLAVIWDELSREFDTGTMKPLETPETVDAMRLMVRSWIKKRPELIAERIAGKVTDKHEHTGEIVHKAYVGWSPDEWIADDEEQSESDSTLPAP